jgi:hypothetical protein
MQAHTKILDAMAFRDMRNLVCQDSCQHRVVIREGVE